MRRIPTAALFTLIATATLLSAGCQANAPAAPTDAQTAAPAEGDSTPTPTPTPTPEDPCVEAEPSGTDGSPTPRDEIELPEWWEDQFPLPQCGVLVLAEQDDYTTSLEFDYADTEALLAAKDEVIAAMEDLGYEVTGDMQLDGGFTDFLAGRDELIGVEVDVTATTDAASLTGTKRWPYPRLSVDFHDFR